MKQQSEATRPSADKARYVLATLLVSVSMVSYYVMTDWAMVLRIVLVLLSVAGAVAILWSTTRGVSVRKHLSDTRREVAQVVWPSRDQTVRMTLIVFAAIVLVGGFLWLIDMFFLWGVQALTGRGG
jgi:preprotein translocase subunit SecE